MRVSLFGDTLNIVLKKYRNPLDFFIQKCYSVLTIQFVPLSEESRI